MADPYPDYVMCWDDGTEINRELREMLLHGLDAGYEIEHAQFGWNADSSLAMTLRLAVSKGLPARQIWEIQLSYPAQEATALHAAAAAEERRWFTMMLRIHITEWWATRISVVVAAARRVK